MTTIRAISCLTVLNAACAFAGPLTLPQLPTSPYTDTEVSTNVQFNAVRSDALEFGVEMCLYRFFRISIR